MPQPLFVSALPRRAAILVFLTFAFSYFLSALIRAITATLSPTLTQEFSLNSGDLGLLAGGYFLGFAANQLPLGTWLDRYGPKKVILLLLSVAALSCVAFSVATSFSVLLAARILSGVGVSACLMAPLTGYRRWFDASTQLRANSWMLMSGSLGMVAATLPVQWLAPIIGWRVLFLGLTVLVLLAMALIAWQVPRWESAAVQAIAPAPGSYRQVWEHPYFRKMLPLGFFCYGGLIAMQTLWVVPWMIKVGAHTPLQAASGLFWINVAMLCTFLTWGMLNPWLTRRGFGAEQLIAWGLPSSFLILAMIIVAGGALTTGAAAVWTLYCVGCTFISLAQPAVAMAFPANLAGRALTSYNLVIFAGVFVVQWGVGLGIDAFRALGWSEIASFQAAMTLFLLCCIGSYVYFLSAKSHNQAI